MRLIIDQDYLGTLIRRRQGRGHSSGPTAHHRHIGVLTAVVEFGFRNSFDIDAAKASNAPDRSSRQQPQQFGSMERFVVKPDRHQPMEPVEYRQKIPAEGGPGVLVLHLHAWRNRPNAGADVGFPVHRHQAVGAVPGGTKQSPRTVIFEATAEGGNSRSVKCGKDGVALLGADCTPVGFKFNSGGAVDDLAGLGCISAYAVQLRSPYYCQLRRKGPGLGCPTIRARMSLAPDLWWCPVGHGTSADNRIGGSTIPAAPRRGWCGSRRKKSIGPVVHSALDGRSLLLRTGTHQHYARRSWGRL